MSSKADKIKGFDASGVGAENGNLFGLPFNLEEAEIVVLPVPWEVTVSYSHGTANGPQVVLEASPQLDLYDFDHPQGWQQGIFMLEIPDAIRGQNDALKPKSAEVIKHTESAHIENNQKVKSELVKTDLDLINQACDSLNNWVFEQSKALLDQGKKVAVLGGDHSVPLGYIQALAQKYDQFGILQIDAHADLRNAYQGFKFSHASIMHNVLASVQVSKLVQMGVRDICRAEVDRINRSEGRIVSYYDAVLKNELYQGKAWLDICKRVVQDLPQAVYISFDVDGLDPKLCPHTGTPVPGGLELEQTFCLFREIIRSGRQIIGFDICEIGDDEWDGNVGARILYKLCNLIGLNQPIH
ncbi:MAG: agmatinase family protein [Cyanothece sp. SIO1E1]|nr:agmatinase family protein [Cyanothece sp. SIO1E1]